MTNRAIQLVALVLFGFAGLWISRSGIELKNRCAAMEDLGLWPEECRGQGWHEPVSTVMIILAVIGLAVIVLLSVRDWRQSSTA